MSIIKAQGKPLCPNHGCPLEGMGFPMPAKGEGMCPVSGAHFAYEVDIDESKVREVKDKNGNITKVSDWKVSGND